MSTVLWVAHHVVSSALIIQRLHEELRNQDPIEAPFFTLAHHTFRATADREGQNTCLALVNSLVRQIARALPDPDNWKHPMEEHTRSEPRTHEQLFAILQRMLAIVGHTIIIIDALDECYSSGARDMNEQALLLTFLSKLSNLKLPTLHLLVTSRPESSLHRSHKQFKLTEVGLSETKEHEDDIAAYVEASLPRNELWDNNRRGMATKALTDSKKSQGM